MRILKVITGVVVSAFIVIQFFQPERNISTKAQPENIGQQLPVTVEVHSILKDACYDCHSNNTQYPWYSYFQPAAWFMDQHIKEGKSELNFDEFGSYSKRRQLSKLKAIGNNVEDGSMPLPSYKLMHQDARLSDSSRKMIIEWALRQADSLAAM